MKITKSESIPITRHYTRGVKDRNQRVEKKKERKGKKKITRKDGAWGREREVVSDNSGKAFTFRGGRV